MKLSHDADDDEAARSIIDAQLRRPDEAVWAQLMSNTYAMQTHRVLCTIEDQTTSSHTHRSEDIAAARQRNLTGDIPGEEWARMADEYTEWRKRAAHFLTIVRQRKRYAADRANALRGFDQADEVRQVLRTLAEAVAEHRAATEAAGVEPEQHDRMLWLRLDSLSVEVPNGANWKTKLSLRDWIAPKEPFGKRIAAKEKRAKRTGRKTPAVREAHQLMSGASPSS
jgi:hypothetical protein